jgi:hypothetical protein
LKLLAGYAAALALFAAAFASREPYDDSHFFKRVAVNALEHGSLAWNVDEGPVFGSTSQAQQLVVLLVTALTRDQSMLAMRLFAALCLLGSVALLFDLTREADRGASVLFGCLTPVALFPLLSGMETTLCLLVGSLFLWLLYQPRARRFGWAPAALAAVLVTLTRPDAALLTLPLLLVERWRDTRRLPLRELLLVAGLLATLLLFFRLYYGTALPLPFYAKQAAFTPYDAYFVELSNRVGLQRFWLFAVCVLPLFLRGALRSDGQNVALLGTAGAFVTYHLVSTIDVMGMHGRFFAPCLPLLIVASARAQLLPASPRLGPRREIVVALAAFGALLAFVALSGALPSGKAFKLDAVPSFFRVSVGLGGAALLLLLSAPRFSGHVVAGLMLVTAFGSLRLVRRAELALYSDDELLDLQASRVTSFRGLASLSACLGNELHVYHSEVGLPGLRFQSGKVTDLAGLVSPTLLFREKTFDELCSEERPEAIFLPHENYRGLNEEIMASPCLRGYRRMVSDSSSPLYVRADLADGFRRCADERKDPFLDVTASAR